MRTNAHDGYGASLAVSLLLHALLFVILFWSWRQQSHLVLETPTSIQAHLVTLAAHAPPAPKTTVAPTETPPPAVTKPAVRDVLPKEAVKAAPPKPQPKPEVQKQNMEKIRQKALLEEKQKQEQIEKQKQEETEKAARAKAAQEKQQADAELAREMADENAQQQQAKAQQQAQADNELATSFQNKIRDQVEQHWNLPLSARSGMEVLLEISLVPTGYVTGVSLVKSSGNDAFDLSAQQAVLWFSNRPFLEVKDIPPQLFEQRFRRFKMLFKPEDKM
jgi:colicin import membrane protein